MSKPVKRAAASATRMPAAFHRSTGRDVFQARTDSFTNLPRQVTFAWYVWCSL